MMPSFIYSFWMDIFRKAATTALLFCSETPLNNQTPFLLPNYFASSLFLICFRQSQRLDIWTQEKLCNKQQLRILNIICHIANSQNNRYVWILTINPFPLPFFSDNFDKFSTSSLTAWQKNKLFPQKHFHKFLLNLHISVLAFPLWREKSFCITLLAAPPFPLPASLLQRSSLVSQMQHAFELMIKTEEVQSAAFYKFKLSKLLVDNARL